MLFRVSVIRGEGTGPQGRTICSGDPAVNTAVRLGVK